MLQIRRLILTSSSNVTPNSSTEETDFIALSLTFSCRFVKLDFPFRIARIFLYLLMTILFDLSQSMAFLHDNFKLRS